MHIPVFLFRFSIPYETEMVDLNHVKVELEDEVNQLIRFEMAAVFLITEDLPNFFHSQPSVY